MDCFSGVQFKCTPGCGFFHFSIYSQNSGYPLRGDRNFLCSDGTRKAVKKTCRWHVFRPWESPSNSRRIRNGCGLNLNMSENEKVLVHGTFPESPKRTLAPKKRLPLRAASFCAEMGHEPSNASVRGTLARFLPDSGNKSQHDRPKIDVLPVFKRCNSQ